MENIDFFTLFQGFGTMAAGGWILAAARLFLIFLRFFTCLFGLERYSRAYGDDTDGIGDDCN